MGGSSVSSRDHFGRDASGLRRKRLFLFDMDGTIYEGERLFPGVIPLLDYIQTHGGNYVFVTNNSSRSPEEYALRLRRMGIETSKEAFFTSTQAAAQLLKAEYPEEKVFCVGTESLVDELREQGIDVTIVFDEQASIVLIGYDTQLRYEKLWDACKMLTRDVTYLATNPDWVCPVEFGAVPDCGSICKMLECATGKWPQFIGKPEPALIQIACKTREVSEKDVVLLGDRLYTDIAAGNRAGVDTICVLTGETTEQEILKSEIKPTYTFHDIEAILDCLCS